MRRFEYTRGSSNKFWEISRIRLTVRVRWGRIGMAGQTKSWTLDTPYLAAVDEGDRIDSKLRKGYVEVPVVERSARAHFVNPPDVTETVPINTRHRLPRHRSRRRGRQTAPPVEPPPAQPPPVRIIVFEEEDE